MMFGLEISKRIFLLMPGLIFLFSSCASAVTQTNNTDKTLTEWSGMYDGPHEAGMLSARNPEELQRMIGFFGESVKKLIPEGGIDFKTSMLAGISLGQKRTGGYSVTIVDAREKDGVLYIRYRERKPGPRSIVTQAITAPFHLKVLSASTAGSVRFDKIDE